MGKGSKTQTDGTGFKQLDISFILPLKPYYLRNLEDGVNAEMASHLLKYVPEFEGVLLSWWDIRFPDPTKSAAIVWEFPDIHVKVAMRLLIFAPMVGQKIRGIVNSVGQDYISLSVFGTWKAHIHETDIPKVYRKVPPSEGDELTFTVKELQIDQTTLSLVGSLQEIGVESQKALTGREKVPDVASEEEKKSSKKKKVKKEETPVKQVKTEPSSSRKRKRDESEEVEEVPKPSAKKHKKDKS